jgi:hypothetical protein
MKIIVNNREFPYETGVRLLRTKNEECQFPEIADIWNEIKPLSFADIGLLFTDDMDKRYAFSCLGIERILEGIEPVLISSASLEKKTSWVREDGSVHIHTYSDVYELYAVRWTDLYTDTPYKKVSSLNKRRNHFVKFRDTSIQKEYMIWLNIVDVYRTNNQDFPSDDIAKVSLRKLEKLINPIQAIAWTITTDIATGGIVKILRQGDCILIQQKPDAIKLNIPRHLTEAEYLDLMSAES